MPPIEISDASGIGGDNRRDEGGGDDGGGGGGGGGGESIKLLSFNCA